MDNRISRAVTGYQPLHQRFVINSKNYSQQYSHLYIVRLNQMRKSLRVLAAEKWGSSVPILARIIDSEGSDKLLGDCVVFGTLFKEMHLRSSVLDEFKEHNGISGGVQPLYNFASKSDFLVLEDDSGRLCLGGSLVQDLAPNTVTGITVAMKGAVDEEGIFQVSDILFVNEKACGEAAEGMEESISRIPDEIEEDAKYVLFASGFHMGQGGPGTKQSTHANDSGLSSQLLMDFISGRLGGEADVRLASKIVRVVVAGNSVVTGDVVKGKDRYTGSKQQSEATLPMRQLDALLCTVLGACPIDLMPGASDPANITLPQQPLHPCLLPNSARFNSLSLVTNPYEACVGDVHILGHSGQPLKSIARQTVRKEIIQAMGDGDDIILDENEESAEEKEKEGKTIRETGDRPITILRNTLRWGHLCPTAPDTLPCYPFTDLDPFVIHASSDVTKRILFAGNQDAFETCVEKSDGQINRLICIPSFSKTKQVVLVNLKTLDCTPISFLSFPNFDDVENSE